MRGLIAAAVLVVGLSGCGGREEQDPPGLVIPETATCEQLTADYVTCTWLDPATQCYFQAHLDPATGKAFIFDTWC